MKQQIRRQIRISGTGGQRGMLLGQLLGEAVTIYDRQHAIENFEKLNF